MKVVIIGAGNVATVLGKKIKEAGHSIVQVVSKTRTHAAELAGVLSASAEDDLSKLNGESEIYIIAVNDNLIEEVSGMLKLTDKIVVHTAGSVSKDILSRTGSNYGVIYPVQSLRKEIGPVPLIPVMVDGDTVEVIEALKQFAGTWAGGVSVAGDEQRLKVHLAAVIASNFTNHLYSLAEAYCKSERVDFHVLLPLIEETATRLQKVSPYEVQTGPAVRADTATIERHLLLLDNYPSIKAIYMTLSESIKNYYH